jgi:hypothetical protein
MRYYIEKSDETLDLLGVIRRIRTNSLLKSDLVTSEATNQAKEAYLYEELYEFFIEQDRIMQEESLSVEEPKMGLFDLLKHGVNILKDDISSAAICGTLIIFTVALCGIGAIKLPFWLVSIFAPIICYLMFNLVLVANLRLARAQLLSFDLIFKVMKNNWVDFLMVALPPALLGFGLPWLLSHFMGAKVWFFASVLTIMLMAYFLYLPILIFDREMTYKQAFGFNHTVIKSLGFEVLLNIMVVLLINMIAGPFILVTLPISLLALMQLYDNRFVEY